MPQTNAGKLDLTVSYSGSLTTGGSMSNAEKYTPEQIIQACSVTLSQHGKIYIDELIMELYRMFPPKVESKGQEDGLD